MPAATPTCWRSGERGRPRSPPPTAKRPTGRRAASANAATGSRPRRMTYNDRRALELLPARIAALEARIDELNAALADPDLYARDPGRFTATRRRRSPLHATNWAPPRNSG